MKLLLCLLALCLARRIEMTEEEQLQLLLEENPDMFYTGLGPAMIPEDEIFAGPSVGGRRNLFGAQNLDGMSADEIIEAAGEVSGEMPAVA